MNKFIKKIFSSESSSGILLLFSAFLALVFVNLPGLDKFYEWFLHFKILPYTNETLNIKVDGSLHFWINDALMAIFFFSIGLELKAEMKEGQLKHFSQVLLPTFAAIGGVIFPAIIFAIINFGDSYAMKGWAIPTATDIAFAVGVLALLGKRVPTSLKIFVLTLAIMDDLCAILIIALFYSTQLQYIFLLLAFAVFALMLILAKFDVSKKLPYIILSILLWFFVLNSGVHATIAGVMAGFAIPLYNKNGNSMLKDILHKLSIPVNFIILPLFAFTNAGVNLHGLDASHLFGSVPIGIFLGLFLGKQIGVFLFSFLIIKLGYAYLPEKSNWKQLYAIAIICGIGFTMSLFVDNLAYYEFPDKFHGTDRLAILAGSLVSGFVGYFVAKIFGNNPDKTLKK
ncbi:Na+/H+ antiporter NhaA [Campylobacter sp. FMV-PI01]|uniref:Na(+)/H(+) antiporter NhaA n=1 Tax=Campylobacter portucalensis TaxID=2608384 RepID=A0A6L5WJZ6_9BACT|nr:Na+/H+ antiporter NhaA [Campylobacter portucalensis]